MVLVHYDRRVFRYQVRWRVQSSSLLVVGGSCDISVGAGSRICSNARGGSGLACLCEGRVVRTLGGLVAPVLYTVLIPNMLILRCLWSSNSAD